MLLHELFRKVMENVRADQNKDLVDYFRVRPIAMHDNDAMQDAWHEFIAYLNEDNKKRLSDHLGVPMDDLWYPQHYYGMPDRGKRYFADWLQDYAANFIEDEPASAPAWMFLTPVTGKLLSGLTPLLHFSDHPEAIKSKGFLYGVANVDTVALSRVQDNNHFANHWREKHHSQVPGYNFAYIADGSIDFDRRAHGYGSGSILFRSGGMLVDHGTDQERQVIFWGPAAKTRDGTVIRQQGDRWMASTGESDKSLNKLVKRLTGSSPSSAPPSSVRQHAMR